MHDEAGFEAFVAARGPALLRLGWLLTTDADAAEDLVQEALARLVRHWDRVSAAGGAEAYVRASMRSIWIDSWRRRRGFSVVPVADPPGPEMHDGGRDGIERMPTRLALDGALRRLAPGQRTVLVLRFYEDLTEVATARALGCSPSTVKSQVRAALARLRELAPGLAAELGEAGLEAVPEVAR